MKMLHHTTFAIIHQCSICLAYIYVLFSLCMFGSVGPMVKYYISKNYHSNRPGRLTTISFYQEIPGSSPGQVADLIFGPSATFVVSALKSRIRRTSHYCYRAFDTAILELRAPALFCRLHSASVPRLTARCSSAPDCT